MKLKNIIVLVVLFLVALNINAAKRVKVAVENRPKLMWVDLSVNWEKFSNIDSASYYINKCVESGFNTLIVDVKGTNSHVAFNSSIAPQLKVWKGYTQKDGYDYLKTIIDLAHAKKMKVYAAFNIFCEGHGIFRDGILYNEKSSWQSMNYVPGKGIVPITQIEGRATAFVNPALPEVQDYERSILVECATKYNVDGVMLDRTRYDGLQSDFSDFSRKTFEKYIGQKLDRFPEDIFEWVKNDDGNYTRKEGKWFKQWIEWRASVIYNFFKTTKESLKKVRKNIKLAAYTGAWYPSYFEVGANWASSSYNPQTDYEWATNKYKDFAYNELLDLYTNGNYFKMVSLDEFRKSKGTYKNETDSEISTGEHLCVEGACKLSRKLLKDNSFCGGIYVEDYKGNVEQFKKAVKMNLKESDGLMVFDIVHIIKNNWWEALKRAIKEQETDMK